MDYFCKMVQDYPALAKEFADKFEEVKEARRTYFNKYAAFEKVHKNYFFHVSSDLGDIPLYWEYPSPDAKHWKQWKLTTFSSF